MSTTLKICEHEVQVTTRHISFVKYDEFGLLFRTYMSSHDEVVYEALNRSQETSVAVGFLGEFSIDDLVTEIIDEDSMYPDEHRKHLLALARIDLLDAIKKIDTFLKVSPPHLLLFPGNTPPVTDSSPDAH